jgi:hypothetical protein
LKANLKRQIEDAAWNQFPLLDRADSDDHTATGRIGEAIKGRVVAA